jgi:transcriptional regulator with XRE-family HTH domain
MSKVLNGIRKAIESSGMSRYALSKATGIDQSQLSKLMSGQGGLSIASLEKLAEHLSLEITIRSKKRKEQ